MLKRIISVSLIFVFMCFTSIVVIAENEICDEECYCDNLVVNDENISKKNGFDIIDDEDRNKGDGNTNIDYTIIDESK